MERKIIVGERVIFIRLKLAVMEHIQEVSGMDAFTFLGTATTNLLFSTSVLLYAAAKCYAEKHNTEVATIEQIAQLVREDGDVTLFQEMADIYGKFLNPGEATQVTEPANPSPGRIAKNSPSEVSA